MYSSILCRRHVIATELSSIMALNGDGALFTEAAAICPTLLETDYSFGRGQEGGQGARYTSHITLLRYVARNCSHARRSKNVEEE